MSPGALDITVLEAEQLKSVKLIGRQRPYIVCQVGEVKALSNVCSTSGKNPVWNETFKFVVTTERTAFITILRKKRIVADDVIGTVEIDLDKALQEGYQEATLPVLTTVGDQCCSQIVAEKGSLRVSLNFTPWQPHE